MFTDIKIIPATLETEEMVYLDGQPPYLAVKKEFLFHLNSGCFDKYASNPQTKE